MESGLSEIGWDSAISGYPATSRSRVSVRHPTRRSVCDATHPREWRFAPTHAVGRTLGGRIALAATHRLNLRLVTPLDMALRPQTVSLGRASRDMGAGPRRQLMG